MEAAAALAEAVAAAVAQAEAEAEAEAEVIDAKEGRVEEVVVGSLATRVALPPTSDALCLLGTCRSPRRSLPPPHASERTAPSEGASAMVLRPLVVTSTAGVVAQLRDDLVVAVGRRWLVRASRQMQPPGSQAFPCARRGIPSAWRSS